MSQRFLVVKIEDESGRVLFHTTVPGKEFSTGSCGFGAQGRIVAESVRTPGEYVEHIVGINITQVHSKPQ